MENLFRTESLNQIFKEEIQFPLVLPKDLELKRFYFYRDISYHKNEQQPWSIVFIDLFMDESTKIIWFMGNECYQELNKAVETYRGEFRGPIQMPPNRFGPSVWDTCRWMGSSNFCYCRDMGTLPTGCNKNGYCIDAKNKGCSQFEAGARRTFIA